MKHVPICIGIVGKRQAGKDTAASMISYILSEGIAKADYYTWLNKAIVYRNSTNIIHFADTLKEWCSQMFGIDIKFFNDTDYKDNYVYCFTEQSFIARHVLNPKKYKEITIEDLSKVNATIPLARLTYAREGYCSVISLRTIMQYIGTNIFRNKISNDIWVDLTMSKVDTIVLTKPCIVADVRFENEADAIRYSEYKTLILGIERDNTTDSHESEQQYIKCDVTIENKDSKMALFYKLVTVLKDFLKQ